MQKFLLHFIIIHIIIILQDYNILNVFFRSSQSSEVSLFYWWWRYEPFWGMLSIARGSINKIGQLFATSICHDGPRPGFLASWKFWYLTHGITAVLLSWPKELLPVSAISELYNKVCKSVVSLNLDKGIWFFRSSIVFYSYVPWKPLILVIKLFINDSQLIIKHFYLKWALVA